MIKINGPGKEGAISDSEVGGCQKSQGGLYLPERWQGLVVVVIKGSHGRGKSITKGMQGRPCTMHLGSHEWACWADGR